MLQTSLNQITVESDFFTTLKYLKAESLQNIVDGKCDAIFSKMLVECTSREKAQDLAYALFSGPRCSRFRQFNSSSTALNYLLIDKKLPAADLCEAIKKVFEDLKSEKIVSDTSAEVADIHPVRPWPGYPGETYQNEDLVAVIHGGGRRHIEAFLQGESSAGYRCDSHLKGIFLTPIAKDKQIIDTGEAAKQKVKDLVLGSRAPLYATRTPLEHCDEPYVIAGLIPRKYLYCVNQNAYEVVLKQEDVTHFQLIFSQSVPATAEHLLILNRDRFLQKFSKNPDLQKRLDKCFIRVTSCVE